MSLATTPAPPYYAVIFSSQLNQPAEAYEETAERMLELAQQQPGFLGVDSARNDIGITVSYWQSLEDIQSWKQQSEHQLAQKKGRQAWYRCYTIRICRVEKAYDFYQQENHQNRLV